MTDTAKNAERIVVDFDQHSHEYRDRYPEISHELRSRCPVVWTESHGGHWIVTGLDEVSEMYKHADLFSAVKDPDPTSPYRGIQIPDPNPGVSAGFLEMDPPTQLAYRHILNPFTSPAAVRKWEPMAHDLTRACLEDVIESGRIDVVDDLANIVPAVVTMALLGLPLDDWKVFSEPMHAFVYTPPDSPDLPRVQGLMFEAIMHIAERVAAARVDPRPGAIKALIDAEIDGEPLPDDKLFGTLFLLIAGGLDTTTALTANAMNWLARNPAERERLRNDRGLLDMATEEFLRCFSPSQGDARTVTRDCVVAGYEFKEHERVLLSFAMPNRDPRVFDEPDELRIDRFPNRHAAFGLGNHRCLGSNVARTQFKAMLWGALQRLGDFDADPTGAERYESIGIINGWRHMPATFPPGEREGPGLAETMATWQARLDREAAEAAGA
ncbi:MAG: cytochrome P450 [Acidimicrobiia bacterium]